MAYMRIEKISDNPDFPESCYKIIRLY